MAIWIALAALAAGLALRTSRWFRHGLTPAARAIPPRTRVVAALRATASTLSSGSIRTLLRSFVLDVLLQRRLWRESAARWIAHAFVAGAVVLLVLVHALGATVVARVVPGYLPTLNPFLFLRDLLGALLLAGLAVAAHRRWVRKVPRRSTRPQDAYALVVLAVIALSGLLLEGTRIASPASFRSMVERYGEGGEADAALEAYWAEEMGTASPDPGRTAARVAEGRLVHARSCASCHASTAWAFAGRTVAAAVRPVAAGLDRSGAADVLFAIHFYACLLALAYLPFSKLFHLLATPLNLLASSVAARGEAGAANLATRQMIALDACTHCCTCSARCAVAMASDASGNERILPSEKMGALRALASGGPLAATQLRSLVEGVFVCTSCERCAVACPSGIDLLGLWASAREALLARGEAAYALLSPLSLRRALARWDTEPAAYREAVSRPRRSIAEALGSAALRDRAAISAPEDGRLWSALRGSTQAGTFASCFGCKTCSTACPVVRSFERPEDALGLLPHQIMHAARLRLWGLVLGSNMLWDCLGCYECQEHCPQGVGVTDVLYELKNVAIARARRHAATPAAEAAP